MKVHDKLSYVHFPDKNCERELEVVQGEDEDLLLPFPSGVADLPVDQTRLNIKNNKQKSWISLVTHLLETDKMHVHFFLQRPVFPHIEAGVGVLTEHRFVAPPPYPPFLLKIPQGVSGVAVFVVLH